MRTLICGRTGFFWAQTVVPDGTVVESTTWARIKASLSE